MPALADRQPAVSAVNPQGKDLNRRGEAQANPRLRPFRVSDSSDLSIDLSADNTTAFGNFQTMFFRR